MGNGNVYYHTSFYHAQLARNKTPGYLSFSPSHRTPNTLAKTALTRQSTIFISVLSYTVLYSTTPRPHLVHTVQARESIQ